MDAVAVGVLLVMLVVSIWSWRLAPGQRSADQFIGIWRTTPWGKQFFLDFFGLEIMLALWMLADAASRGRTPRTLVPGEVAKRRDDLVDACGADVQVCDQAQHGPGQNKDAFFLQMLF